MFVVDPIIGSSLIGVGGKILGGLFGGESGEEKAAKLQLAEIRRQQRERAREFAGGVGEIDEFADESLGLGRDLLFRGRRGLRRTKGDLRGEFDALGDQFDESLRATRDEIGLQLGRALPGRFSAGIRSGFSPRGGRSGRAVAGAVGQAQGAFDRALIQNRLSLADRRRALLGDIAGLDLTQVQLGTGLRAEGGGLKRDIFKARLDTPGASAAERGELGESEADLQARTVRDAFGLIRRGRGARRRGPFG